MPSLSRREALRAGVVAAGVGLAGCSSGSDVPAVSFDELLFWNADSAPHTGTVFIFESGEPVYRATMDAEAARETEESTEVGGGGFENYPIEPGRYELYAWYGEQARDDWSHVRFGAETVPSELDGPVSVKIRMLLEPRGDDLILPIYTGGWDEIETTSTAAPSVDRSGSAQSSR